MDRDKNCLVLGGAGFLGKHLVEKLLSSGCFVRAYDRSDTYPLLKENKRDLIEYVSGDFLRGENFSLALKDIDVVYHLISTSLPKESNNDPALDVESNVIPTIRFLDHALKAGVKKIIFFSSGGTVYGEPHILPIPETHITRPLCAYGAHKITIEIYLDLYFRLYRLDYRIIRIANPFGKYQDPLSSQGVIPVFMQKILKGQEIDIWGDGKIIRDYIHVDDVNAAAVCLMSYKGTEKIFNIGGGKGYSLIEIIELLEVVVGRKAKVKYSPHRLMDVSKNILDIRKAALELNWKPIVSIEEGMRRLMPNFSKWL